MRTEKLLIKVVAEDAEIRDRIQKVRRTGKVYWKRKKADLSKISFREGGVVRSEWGKSGQWIGR